MTTTRDDGDAASMTPEELLYAIFGDQPEDDPDCDCGHPVSEHGQTFDRRCYSERTYEGNTCLCSCDQLHVSA